MGKILPARPDVRTRGSARLNEAGLIFNLVGLDAVARVTIIGTTVHGCPARNQNLPQCHREDCQ
jgi:hypothetical protein